MLYFNVTSCSSGDVYTYDGGRCVKNNHYDSNERCYISVLENCELEVHVFLITNSDHLYLGETGYTGSSGPPDGTVLSEGDLFIFVTGSSANIPSTYDGFDMCCKNLENFELRNGTRASEGNVYLNGQPICHNHWNTEDASIVCSVLGYDFGEATNSSTFGVVPNNFIMDEVDCTGSEASVWDCGFATPNNCSSSDGAGVRCSNEPYKKDNYTYFVVIPILIIAFLFLLWYIFQWRNNKLKTHQNNQYDQLGIALQKKEAEKAAASSKQEVSKDAPKEDPTRVSYQPLLDSNLPKFKSSSEEEDSVEEFPEDVEIIRLASNDVTDGNEASAPPASADINPAYVPPSYQP